MQRIACFSLIYIFKALFLLVVRFKEITLASDNLSLMIVNIVDVLVAE